uniref:non-specific serine/threonine protein kinase n=1 Tax=Thermogemmatispora argillosa TaxID=2045280 RepID=A0A455T2G0_9CHLR|nr:hypothetical protein KTA_08740 [Thermogemmatispora argillosa]
MADYSGHLLGHYRLERLLGQGSFAQVYLATHLHLGTPAAIKVLHQATNHEAIEQFQREARTIAPLVHPHIVRVLDFGLHEGRFPYLVMDYLPGGSLRQRYPAGSRLPLAVALDYTCQIAEALQYAHESGIIHRDVKPENMLIGHDGSVLLADFGIATIVSSTRLQSTQDLAGTVTYMAPEQIQGYPRPESDQYALAVVLYEWLVGAPPFAGSFNEIAVQHCTAAVPPLRQYVPEISPDIEAVIQRALAKDWRARFASVEEFASALQEATAETVRSPLGVQQPPLTSPSSGSSPYLGYAGSSLSRSLHSSQTAFQTAVTEAAPPLDLQPANAKSRPGLRGAQTLAMLLYTLGMGIGLVCLYQYSFRASSETWRTLIELLLLVLFLPMAGTLAGALFKAGKGALVSAVIALILIVNAVFPPSPFSLWWSLYFAGLPLTSVITGIFYEDDTDPSMEDDTDPSMRGPTAHGCGMLFMELWLVGDGLLSAWVMGGFQHGAASVLLSTLLTGGCGILISLKVGARLAYWIEKSIRFILSIFRRS